MAFCSGWSTAYAAHAQRIPGLQVEIFLTIEHEIKDRTNHPGIHELATLTFQRQIRAQVHPAALLTTDLAGGLRAARRRSSSTARTETRKNPAI